MKYVKSRDEIETFIPSEKTNFVILGTMCSAAARAIGSRKAASDAFYYHSPINRFWIVMQMIFEKRNEIKKLTIAEKKQFLNKHGIAIVNIVQEIHVPEEVADDPSDTILFGAHKCGKLKFKEANDDFRKILSTKPLFFTCRFKKDIHNLIAGYLDHNRLEPQALEKLWYLHSPTRRSAKYIANLWTSEMSQFLKL